MPAGSETLIGPRLSFVVRKLPGTIKRTKYKAPPTEEAVKENPALKKDLSNHAVEVTEDAGYMVYLPNGGAYRLSASELIKRGYDKEPEFLGYEQANDQKTAMGRYKLARTESARQKAWKEMEDEVVNVCLGRVGKVDALVSDYDPHGKLEKEAA